MKTKSLVIAGLLLTSVSGLWAQTVEISPFFGYRFGGSIEGANGQNYDLNAGPSYGLALDIPMYEKDLKFELFWSRENSGVDFNGAYGLGDIDVTVDQFMLGGVYEMGQGRLRETVTALVGASVFDPDGADMEARFAFGFGVGVKYELTKNIALRADARGFCTIVESDSTFISTGGITVLHFSGSTLWQGEVTAGVTVSF